MKKYTRKQISEAIKYWKKQLNESLKNCELDAVMMYLHYEDAYESGDQDWLYVAKDMQSLCNTLAELEPQDWSYEKGYTASPGSPEFFNLLKAIRRDSISRRGPVRITITIDEQYESDVTLNFCFCEQPIDSSHVIYCD